MVNGLQVFASLDTKQTIKQLELSPDGLTVYALFENLVGVFQIAEMTILQSRFQTFRGVSKIKVSHGGGYLAICMDNDVSPVIDIYRVESGELQCSLKCHNAQITYVDFLSGDAVFVSSSTDGVFYGH